MHPKISPHSLVGLERPSKAHHQGSKFPSL
nr:MAG TPA: hypothetical protein [Caudoviricetes sp.]